MSSLAVSICTVFRVCFKAPCLSKSKRSRKDLSRRKSPWRRKKEFCTSVQCKTTTVKWAPNLELNQLQNVKDLYDDFLLVPLSYWSVNLTENPVESPFLGPLDFVVAGLFTARKSYQHYLLKLFVGYFFNQFHLLSWWYRNAGWAL